MEKSPIKFFYLQAPYREPGDVVKFDKTHFKKYWVATLAYRMWYESNTYSSTTFFEWSYAICNPKYDNFSKKIGRKIATGRLGTLCFADRLSKRHSDFELRQRIQADFIYFHNRKQDAKNLCPLEWEIR